MELEQAKKRVKELRAVIEKNNRLYYDQDAPELEDFEYDALTRELKELEAQAVREQLTAQKELLRLNDIRLYIMEVLLYGKNNKSVFFH